MHGASLPPHVTRCIIRFGRSRRDALRIGLARSGGVTIAPIGYPRQTMLNIPAHSLQEGCERAHDLFKLNSMRGHEAAADSFDAVFEALGFDDAMRARLQDTLVELVPVKGDPMLETSTTMSMAAGVLIGLLIADSALPADELDLPVTAG
jgi:hypothetical protein